MSRFLLGAALGSSLSTTFPASALWPVPSTCPIVGRKESFSVPALGPPSDPHPDPQGRMQVPGIQRGELAPLCRVGVHLSAPAPPLLRPPEAGPPRLGRTVPGGAERGKETTESAERSPGPSPSGAGDGGVAGADRQGWLNPRAERGRRDSTSHCRASALAPSRARPARGPAPAPSGGPAPPRPAPTGDPTASSGGTGGGSELSTLLPLRSLRQSLPRCLASYLGPGRPGPLHRGESRPLAAARLNPKVRKEPRLSFVEHGKAFRRAWPLR